MGPIVDRSKEYLGSTDRAIITLRRLLLQATAAAERGEVPPGADPRTHRAIRPVAGIVPPGGSWRDAFAAHLVCKW